MIYCVEDDEGSRELMLYTLKSAGFEARGFGNGESFRKAMVAAEASNALPDLIMLDIMLPDDDGISILHKLREKSSTEDIPVIMASAKGTEYDKVIGLDLGADDYLAKPFGMMEMLSRVKAVLRRRVKKCDSTDSDSIEISGITMDLKAHKVMSAGQPVELTLKEFDLLRLFLMNPGKVFTREDLLSSVWSSDFVGESRTVDVHIGTLRSKLGNAGEAIATVRGVGYRLERTSQPDESDKSGNSSLK